MSVIFNESTESLVRTTNLIPKTCNTTIMFFFRYIATPGGPPTFNTQWYWGDNPATLYNDYVFIGVNTSDAITMDVGIDGTGSVVSYTLPDFGLYHIAYVRNGTTHELWVNGVKQASQVLDINIATFTAPTHQMLGGDTLAADWDDGEYAYYKEWTVALTSQEIISEMQAANFAVVKTADLWVNTPLVADILDDSGNGYDWSVFAGSNTFTTGVLNQDEENARPVINLPVAFSQNAVSGAVTYDLWYRYQRVSADIAMGIFGFGDLVTYLPKVSVKTGTLGSLLAYRNLTNIGPNLPIQIPIETSPTPNFFYFKFTTNSGNPTPAVLIFDLQPGSKGIIPAGSLFVNDDTQNFPGVFIDDTALGVLNFVSPFPNGEGGDVLTGGYMVFEDFGNNQILTYDNQFNEDKTIAFGTGFVRIRANQTADCFWMGNQVNPSVVKRVDNTGVVTSTLALTGNANLSALAGNNNDTILYYSANATGAPIKRWDIPGDVALSDLVAGVTGNFISDILVLPDGTILASFVKTFTTFIVRQYNSGGTLLNTFDLGTGTFPSGTQPRIAYSHDASLTFWAWSHALAGTSRWRRVVIADGTFQVDVSPSEYESGIYEPDATATPTARFGTSFSCPFIILPPTPGGGVPSSNSDGTLLVGSGSGGGGLYELVPDKTDDTLWVTQSPESTQDVKKPDPTATLGDIGQ